MSVAKRMGFAYCASLRCRGRPCNKKDKVKLQIIFFVYWDSLIAHPSAAAGVLAIKNIKQNSNKFGFALCFLLRKEWDSNPRYDKNRTPDFESGPFDHSGIFP